MPAHEDIILAEKSKGKTILLTTHNMYDATEPVTAWLYRRRKAPALDSPRNLIMSREPPRYDTLTRTAVKRRRKKPCSKIRERTVCCKTLFGRIGYSPSTAVTHLKRYLCRLTGRRLQVRTRALLRRHSLQYKYGFYFLYLVFTLFISECCMPCRPLAGKGRRFNDFLGPRRNGLYFMGAIVLFERASGR